MATHTSILACKLESRLPREIASASDIDDTALMEESEEELKSLLMKVKEGSEKGATPELLPGESRGQRSLVGCSPGGREESIRLINFTFTFHFHPLEKEMATHSSVLAWRIPGMGKPGGLLSMGLHRVGYD